MTNLLSRRSRKGFVLGLLAALAISLVVLACERSGPGDESDYEIVNTGIKGGGCWYDDSRLALLQGHQAAGSQEFIVEGMYYLDVSRPRELKQIDLAPIEPEVQQRIYRMRCAEGAILFSVDHSLYKVHIGETPEKLAERENSYVYPDYVSEGGRYVLAIRSKQGPADPGISSTRDAAMEECQIRYLKPGYKALCWHADITGLPWSLPRFVFSEYRWSETINVTGEDGQRKRVPNPKPPLKLTNGREIKHGYLLRDLENRIVQLIPLEQEPYRMEAIYMTPDPQGEYVYTSCFKTGDHEPRYFNSGRVCRFKLDGRNEAWEEVFSPQTEPNDTYDLQGFDVNVLGDVVAVDMGHALNVTLWKYTAATKTLTRITAKPDKIAGPKLSPNGKTITFFYRNELYLAFAKGGPS